MFLPLVADIIANEKQTLPIVVTLILVSFYSSSALLNFYVGHLADSREIPGVHTRERHCHHLAGLPRVRPGARGTDATGLLYFIVAASRDHSRAWVARHTTR